MQWWCAALGEQWTWAWKAYPGVWLFIAAVAGSCRAAAGRGAWATATPGERTAFATGLLTLWASLDWPLGPIAAGYLASAHALQFLVITMVSAPLLLVAVRRHVAARATDGVPAGPLRLLVHPLVAAIVFNIIVAASHVPSVVDTLMPTPWGAFATDLAWFVGGLIFWWPVIVPVPARRHFGPPVKILYLLVGTLFHTVIGMIMLIAEHPMFGIYELAPPVFAIDPRADQQLAGGIMELGVFFAIVAAAGVLFFRWAAADERAR